MIKLKNMAAINPGESDFDTDAECDNAPPPRYLFIFDDIISDRQFKSYNSKLSDFSTYSRHYEIAIIINSQKYNKIPTTIREQSPLSILCSVDNYRDYLVQDHCVRG